MEPLVESRRGPPPSLRGLRRTLYPYQREGVARLLDGERLLLADDMGLGKTIQAVAACHVLYHARRVRRGLVIAPASLKSQWEREWRETTKVPVTVVEGSPAERAQRGLGLGAGGVVQTKEVVHQREAALGMLGPGVLQPPAGPVARNELRSHTKQALRPAAALRR